VRSDGIRAALVYTLDSLLFPISGNSRWQQDKLPALGVIFEFAYFVGIGCCSSTVLPFSYSATLGSPDMPSFPEVHFSALAPFLWP